MRAHTHALVGAVPALVGKRRAGRGRVVERGAPFSPAFCSSSACSFWASSSTFRAGSADQPDDEQALGESATLVEVASSLLLAPWSPGPWICNRKARNGEWYTSAYSPVYSIMWIFLFVWLAMCGVYLIIVGIHVEIEVFRGERHVTAALLIGLALVLCAVWSAIFRLGSKSKAWKEEYAKRLAAHRANQEGKEVKPGETDYNEWEDNPEPDKKHWRKTP